MKYRLRTFIKFYICALTMLLVLSCNCLPVRGETLDSTETTENVTEEKKESKKKDYDERAQEILDSMTTKQKVAQMFLVGALSGEAAVSIAKKYQFGGYVFFANEFQNKTPAQAKSKMKRIQKASNVTSKARVYNRKNNTNNYRSNN